MARLGLGVTGLAAVLAGAALSVAPVRAGPIPLASYRAIYDLALDDTAKESDVGNLAGRLVTEFTGSECAGYKAKLRFVTSMDNSDGQQEVTDSRSTTFEAGDGHHFTFTNETYSNEGLVEQSVGTADRSAGGVAVALTKPDRKHFGLAVGVAFPTEQIAKVLDAARAGEKFVSIDVYDGSEDGQTVFATAAVIGPGSSAPDDVGDEKAIADAGISGLRHWPVTISYFDKKKGGESTPFYVMSFVVYEDGVGRKLKIDYGDFAISGKLTGLQILPADPCP